ncbi:MAG TPA: DUF2254 domain-containing protein [Fontimonas sp.]
MTSNAGLRARLRFFLNRVQERLWVRPLLYCLLSVAAAFFAGLADRLAERFDLLHVLPQISIESVRMLLSIIAASMLGMAVFAVGSMVAAFQAAGTSATPRAFALVIADDVSQTALSTFIGAFIFSVVGISALSNGYYGASGHLVLFAMTLGVLLLVILRFLQWVDRIARLGRIGETIEKVEAATARALRELRLHPRMGGTAATDDGGLPLESSRVGYLQRIDMAALQAIAEKESLQLDVGLLPGSLVGPGRCLAKIRGAAAPLEDSLRLRIERSFVIGSKRTFDEDPRFGFVVLSQIASRALSPAVNDPGTAIDILTTHLRLFTAWAQAAPEAAAAAPAYDRIGVPALSVDDLLDDAFNAIARDGAALVEVAVRLQRVLQGLASLPDPALAQAAARHACHALVHAERALLHPAEQQQLRAAGAWVGQAIAAGRTDRPSHASA